MQVEGTMWRLRKLLSLLDLVFPGSELAAPAATFYKLRSCTLQFWPRQSTPMEAMMTNPRQPPSSDTVASPASQSFLSPGFLIPDSLVPEGRRAWISCSN
jgi:hypothetical protein